MRYIRDFDIAFVRVLNGNTPSTEVRRLRLALVHPQLDTVGGAEKAVLQIARGLKKLGNEVIVYTLINDETIYPKLKKGLEIVACSSSIMRPVYSIRTTRRARRLNFLPGVLSLARKIDKHVDLINCFAFPSTWSAARFKKRTRVPLVWTCFEPPFWHQHKELVQRQYRYLRQFLKPVVTVDNMLVQTTDRILTISFLIRGIIRESYGRDSQVIRVGVDPEDFKGADGESVRERYGIADKRIVLAIGPLTPIKRTMDAILAMRLISRHVPNAVLLVEGEGPLENELKSFVRKSTILSERVIFLGRVLSDELKNYYAASEVVLFPSIREAWGLVPFEAMLLRKAVVVSRDTGAAEVLRSGVNSVVVEPCRPDLMAEETIQLLTNDELRRSIGDSGRDLVLKDLRLERTVAEFAQVLHEVASARR